jgi:hypothetical protein
VQETEEMPSAGQSWGSQQATDQALPGPWAMGFEVQLLQALECPSSQGDGRWADGFEKNWINLDSPSSLAPVWMKSLPAPCGRRMPRSQDMPLVYPRVMSWENLSGAEVDTDCIIPKQFLTLGFRILHRLFS